MNDGTGSNGGGSQGEAPQEVSANIRAAVEHIAGGAGPNSQGPSQTMQNNQQNLQNNQEDRGGIKESPADEELKRYIAYKKSQEQDQMLNQPLSKAIQHVYGDRSIPDDVKGEIIRATQKIADRAGIDDPDKILRLAKDVLVEEWKESTQRAAQTMNLNSSANLGHVVESYGAYGRSKMEEFAAHVEHVFGVPKTEVLNLHPPKFRAFYEAYINKVPVDSASVMKQQQKEQMRDLSSKLPKRRR